MSVYSVKPGTNVTVTDPYGNPVVGVSSTPSFTTLNVTGTATVGGTLTHSGGYALLGSFNSSSYPPSGNGLGLSYNFSNGGRDVALWNTDTAATTLGFVFRQLTGASSQTTLAIIGTGGITANVGSFIAGSSTYGPSSATVAGALTASYYISNAAAGTAQFTFTNGAGGSNQTALFAASSGTSGVTSTALSVYGIGLATPQLLAIDASGNVGALGSFKTGSSIYGPASATVAGTLVVNSTVTAANFIAASAATIVLSNAGAASGTGYYFDTINAAVRCNGGFYFQGASGVGTCSIANVGNITGTGLLNLGGVGTHTFGTAGSTSANSVILALGNNQGGSNLAYITTHDATSIAGIVGTCLGFGQIGVAALGALDLSGNFAVTGSFYAVSASDHKRGIRDVSFDAVEVIKNTTVAHFNYTHDPDDHEERLGLIADQSPTEISPTQDRHDFMRVSAVTIAALQDVIARLEALEASHA